MKKIESCNCEFIHEDKVKTTLNKMLNEEKINRLSELFKTLGDKTRMKILFCIDNEEMCVCDIAYVLGMNKSAISHQLAILKQFDIVKSRKDGKEVFYSLYDEHIRGFFEVGFEHIAHKYVEGL